MLSVYISRHLTEPLMQLYWNEDRDSGYPTLVIRVGQATRDYSKKELLLFAEAIITQVEQALKHRLSDDLGCPEQMTVVAHCQGVAALKVHPKIFFWFSSFRQKANKLL